MSHPFSRTNSSLGQKKTLWDFHRIPFTIKINQMWTNVGKHTIHGSSGIFHEVFIKPVNFSETAKTRLHNPSSASNFMQKLRLHPLRWLPQAPPEAREALLEPRYCQPMVAVGWAPPVSLLQRYFRLPWCWQCQRDSLWRWDSISNLAWEVMPWMVVPLEQPLELGWVCHLVLFGVWWIDLHPPCHRHLREEPIQAPECSQTCLEMEAIPQRWRQWKGHIHVTNIGLMVQKSPTTTVWMVLKPVVNNGINYQTSTGESPDFWTINSKSTD